MGTIRLIGQFFVSLPPEHYLALAPWHLWGVLGVTGLLSALGLHYLIGHLFRFYRVRGRPSFWMALPTLPVLTAAALALLALYGVGVRGPELVNSSLRTANGGSRPLTEELGRILLAPAFSQGGEEAGEEGGEEAGDPTGGQLATAFQAIASEDLRQSFLAEDISPASLPAEERIRAVMVSIAREWLTDPDQEWPGAMPAKFRPAGGVEGGEDAGDAPFRLGEFVPALIGEIGTDAALGRGNWEHIASRRFQDYVLRPLLEDAVAYGATGAAGLVALVALLHFYLLGRLRRWAVNRAPATKMPAASTPAKTAKQIKADAKAKAKTGAKKFPRKHEMPAKGI